MESRTALVNSTKNSKYDYVLNSPRKLTVLLTRCDYLQEFFRRSHDFNDNQSLKIRTKCKNRTNDKSKNCEICSKIFNRKNRFKIHLRVPTGVKPYKCDVCNRAFDTLSHLKVHKIKHTEEKPYQCDVCKYSCSSKSNLTRHMKIHTEECLFTCDICNQSFCHKALLKSHIKYHT